MHAGIIVIALPIITTPVEDTVTATHIPLMVLNYIDAQKPRSQGSPISEQKVLWESTEVASPCLEENRLHPCHPVHLKDLTQTVPMSGQRDGMGRMSGLFLQVLALDFSLSLCTQNKDISPSFSKWEFSAAIQKFLQGFKLIKDCIKETVSLTKMIRHKW